jgi:hypothetical protein
MACTALRSSSSDQGGGPWFVRDRCAQLPALWLEHRNRLCPAVSFGVSAFSFLTNVGALMGVALLNVFNVRSMGIV